jgi:hypothetical protein
LYKLNHVFSGLKRVGYLLIRPLTRTCLCLLFVSGCQTAGNVPLEAEPVVEPDAINETVAEQHRVIEDLGIEIIAVRTTAAGSMLDFRFKVLDKEKAMPFFLKELKPHLIDEKTGATLQVPVPAKGGPMRPTSRDPRVGITYFMLFGNPGKYVKPGQLVSIVVGEHHLKHIVVE